MKINHFEELECWHLYIALDQGYIDQKQFDAIYNQANKTGMIISGLIKYLSAKQTRPTKKTEKTRETRSTRLTRETRLTKSFRGKGNAKTNKDGS